MNQSVLNQARSRMNARRQEAENVAIANKISALQDESFSDLYQQYVHEMIQQAKEGKQNAQLQSLQKSLDQRLQALGIGSIHPAYSCPTCQDQGYIDGKMCRCLKREINEILIRESGFKKLERFDTADFSLFENPAYMRQVYQKLQDWCHSNFTKNLIYLSGNTGTGKTHLMQCIASELIARGKVVTLTTAFKMNQDFLKSHASRLNEEKEALINKYLNSEVLFIDDLGTEIQLAGITTNYLYNLLNERKVRNLPTIITSNLDLKNLGDYYDERIASRVADTSSIRLQLENADLRFRKK